MPQSSSLNNTKGYVNIVFYDLPTIYELSMKHYRVFRKNLLKLGYYQLQESVYCKYYPEKVYAKRAIDHIKKATPTQGNIRALVVSKKSFDDMEIILGELSTEEKIIRKKSVVVEL